MARTTPINKTEIIDMITLDLKGVTRTEIARRFRVTKGRGSQILNAPENQQIKQKMTQQTHRTIDRAAAKLKAQIAKGANK